MPREVVAPRARAYDAPMDARIKLPDVAGHFYPREADALGALVDRLLAEAQPPALSPKALVIPHAGMPYSGPIAASGWALLARRRAAIRRVVIVGPAHRMAFDGIAVLAASHWQTPLGRLATDAQAFATALAQPGVQAIDAPFIGEHSLEVQLPFVQRALDDVTVLPVLVGRAAPLAVAHLLHALWGGPETAIVVSSDLSHYLEHEQAASLDADTSARIERGVPDGIGPAQACGHVALRALIAHARARDLRATAVDVRTSGDTTGNLARVVGYGTYAFEDAHGAALGDDDRARLLESARASVRAGLHDGRPAAPPHELPRTLLAQRNTFVTLQLGGALRGCVGSLRPQRSLAADVCENAWKAAFADPRFPKMTPEEAGRLEVSVSVLSHPRPIAADSEARLCEQLRPHRDGLILSDGERSALFLPSVWRSIADPRAFVRQLKRKAGMPEDGWSPTLHAQRFGAEYFGDAESRG